MTVDTNARRLADPSRSTGSVEAALPFLLAYAVAVYCGMGLLSPLGMSAIWIGNGIVVAGLVLLGRPAGLCLLFGSLFVNILTAAALSSPGGRPVFLSSLNFLETVVAYALLTQVCGRKADFADGRRLFAYVVGAASPACLIAAATLKLAGPAFALPVPDNAAEQWFASHLTGIVVAPPCIVVIAQFRRYRAIELPLWDFALGMAGVALGSVAVLFTPVPGPVMTLVLPMLLLAGFRYGPVGAAVGSLIVATVSWAAMSVVMHPSAMATLPARIHTAQFFSALGLLTSLPIGGAVANAERLRNLLARRSETARAARRRADAAAEAKGEFLANMSHEIRTPLNGVLGLADALSRTELTPPQRDMIRMILSSGRTLNGLLSDTLDLARADSGALKLAAEPFDVRETVGSAAFLFETLAREKDLAFEVAFDLPEHAAVAGDPLRIRQVISNLISNAVKFTALGAIEVHVALKPAGAGRWLLEARVSDTGVGFDEAVKARLFNRFEQGDSSVTRRFGGSGLGLAIARKLAQMMGGDIACDSTPGEGSTFTFTVPLEACGAPALAAAPAPSPEPRLRPATRIAVLLADDHPVNRRVIQTMLADAAEITVAEDGAAALDAWRSQAFDLVLMDTHMPVMDGLSAIRAIRDAEAGAGRARTPIVSLTADSLPQHVEAALSAGADLHLVKPITGQALFAAIETALAGPRAAARAKAG